MKILFKTILLLILLVVIGAAVVFGYTAYAKTFGIEKFGDGGYLVFDAPHGTYIPERSITLIRLGVSLVDYTAPARIVDQACDRRCAFAGQSTPQYLMVWTVPPARRDSYNQCTNAVDITVHYPANKRLIACRSTVNGNIHIDIGFQVSGDKLGWIVLSSPSEDFIRANEAYVTAIINNARYEASIWPTLAFLMPGSEARKITNSTQNN